MNKRYPFWKLLRAQWSWKNDRIMMLGNFGMAILINGLNIFSGEVTYTETGEPVSGLPLFLIFITSSGILGVLMVLTYHAIKLILLSIPCYLLCYGLNKNKWVGNDHYEMVERYEKMLAWRQ